MFLYFIPILATIGFVVSFYIFAKKHKGEPLVCPLGKGCNVVVTSRYNNLLGVPNEVFGMFYYAGVMAVAALVMLGVMPFPSTALHALTAVAGVAALFSVVLIGIQGFVLKAWCEWCVSTSVINLAIFASLAVSTYFSFY